MKRVKNELNITEIKKTVFAQIMYGKFMII